MHSNFENTIGKSVFSKTSLLSRNSKQLFAAETQSGETWLLKIFEIRPVVLSLVVRLHSILATPSPIHA